MAVARCLFITVSRMKRTEKKFYRNRCSRFPMKANKARPEPIFLNDRIYFFKIHLCQFRIAYDLFKHEKYRKKVLS